MKQIDVFGEEIDYFELNWKHKTKGEPIMELKDTVKLMNSEDYKERFKAEYFQTKIRYEKLKAMTTKYEAGTLNFEPKCSLDLLSDQQHYMGQYLHCLEMRAELEGIDISYNISPAKDNPFIPEEHLPRID